MHALAAVPRSRESCLIYGAPCRTGSPSAKSKLIPRSTCAAAASLICPTLALMQKLWRPFLYSHQPKFKKKITSRKKMNFLSTQSRQVHLIPVGIKWACHTHTYRHSTKAMQLSLYISHVAAGLKFMPPAHGTIHEKSWAIQLLPDFIIFLF